MQVMKNKCSCLSLTNINIPVAPVVVVTVPAVNTTDKTIAAANKHAITTITEVIKILFIHGFFLKIEKEKVKVILIFSNNKGKPPWSLR